MIAASLFPTGLTLSLAPFVQQPFMATPMANPSPSKDHRSLAEGLDSAELAGAQAHTQGMRRRSSRHRASRLWDRESPPVASGDRTVVGPRKESPAQNDEMRTTVMMRNLPNNFSRDDLLHLIDSRGFSGRYDFIYCPIDFRTHASLGYAFINCVSPQDAVAFRAAFDGFSLWGTPISKVCNVVWSAPHQGLECHIARYRNSPLMHESVPEAYRPVLFAEGARVEFPAPTKRIKPPRQGTERMLV
mmetsp:Transcript_22066/g.63132  ORF Transcript_22066/g.63132 Transcript_22066/m.63132 type:complete len:245 (-) Transcript_22066:178-912(-)